MIRNPDWYDLNEQRSWPVADQATQIDDTGKRLPHDLLADMNVWFPKILGDYAFIGGITVSKNIATVTLLGTASGNPPIAAVSVTAPIDLYRQYAVEPLYPGVGGWVVFGSAVNDGVLHSHRFSDSTQAVLIPHVARSYKVGPVQNAGKLGNITALTGIVRLQGGDDIEIVKESREIDSVVRDAAVFRLKSKPDFVEDVNLYEKYAGPCGKRPESNNCGDSAPIEFINSVAPDCCGNITIEFRGCAEVTFIQNEDCSVAVGCHFGLSDACVTADKLPDAEGKLPNEYKDLCVDESIISSESAGHVVAFAVNEDNFYVRKAQSSELDARLPYTEDFSNQKALDYSLVSGKYNIVADNELPMFGGFSLESQPVGRATIIWKKGIPQTNWSTYYRNVVLHFSMRKAEQGLLHNAGFIFCYDESTGGYWSIEADQEGTFTGVKGLRLAYTKNNITTTYASVPVKNMTPNMQYSLEVTILPDDTQGAWITATLTNAETIDSKLYVNATIGPFLLANYGPANGLFGFTTYRAVTQYNRIIVDNVEVL